MLYSLVDQTTTGIVLVKKVLGSLYDLEYLDSKTCPWTHLNPMTVDSLWNTVYSGNRNISNTTAFLLNGHNKDTIEDMKASQSTLAYMFTLYQVFSLLFDIRFPFVFYLDFTATPTQCRVVVDEGYKDSIVSIEDQKALAVLQLLIDWFSTYIVRFVASRALSA